MDDGSAFDENIFRQVPNESFLNFICNGFDFIGYFDSVQPILPIQPSPARGCQGFSRKYDVYFALLLGAIVLIGMKYEL